MSGTTELLQAVQLANSLLSAAVYTMAELQKVSDIILKMQTEGRNKFTPEELALITKTRDEALNDLADVLK